MICRMWRGWTSLGNAAAYDSYLRNELFPHVKQELGPRGYRGFHLLERDRDGETEFVTQLWFESLESVRGFAGADYEKSVISEKAKKLLSRHADRCEHYQLSGFDWPAAAEH
jgi:heme-degrading monooxygenase HmoA